MDMINKELGKNIINKENIKTNFDNIINSYGDKFHLI